MLKYLLFGMGLAFAAGIQPGPLQAFFLSRVATHGWRRTLPACLAPLISDGPIACVALLVLGRLPPGSRYVLQSAGGLLLLYFAWVAFLQWRDPAKESSAGSAPRTLLEAALVNLLNPNPYLGWAFVIGPLALAAWNEQKIYAVGLIAAFYGTMVLTMAGFILLVGMARFLSPRGQRALIGVSAGILALLGVYLLAGAAWHLAAEV